MPETTRRQPRVKAKPVEPIADTREEAQPMTVAEFCGLDAIDMRIIDLKISLAREVRERRKAAGLTQAALAKRLDVATPRVGELESGRPGTSLETLLAAFFAVGATGTDLAKLGRENDSLVGI